MSISKSRAGEISGGLFLIGLAFIFLTSYWFPGMLFLIGFITIVNALLEGKSAEQATGGFALIGLGVIFAIGFNVGALLLMVGVMVLAGAFFKSDKGQEVMGEWSDKPKRKHNDIL